MPVTIADILQLALDTCAECAKTDPLPDLGAGSEATVTVDSDLGAVEVTVTVSAPLRAARGSRVRLSTRPVMDVTLPPRIASAIRAPDTEVR